jgi:hypothetical protein
MVINTTTWSPDTCECQIEYDWDSEATEENRTHTLKRFVNKCQAHAALGADDNIWNTVLEENPRKNVAHQLILDNGPAALSDLIDGSRRLKAGITFNFSWSGTAPNRVLTISVNGLSLTTQQRNAIETFLANRFGAGRVLIA